MAFLIFIGLVHLLLGVQGKATPETMDRLHGLPVIGGFFLPKARPVAEDPRPDSDAARALAALEIGREFFPLPSGFSREELEELLSSVERARTELTQRAENLTVSEAAAATARAQIEAERAELLAAAERLTKEAELLETSRQSLDRDRGAVDRELTRRLKNLAPIFEGMDPAEAAKKVAALETDVAARLLLLMDSRKSSRVLAAMETADGVRLTARMPAIDLSEGRATSDSSDEGR